MVVVLIRTVEETGSTNEDVAALAREGAPEGVWLRAEQQTGGKGRQGRAWLSPPGNLYASTLVRLQPNDPPAPSLALVAAVALHEAIAPYGHHIQIKWPNDLVLGCSPAKAGAVRAGLRPSPEHTGGWAKLAGILLERQSDAVVIGFGVNVAHKPDLPDRATAHLGEMAPPPAILAELLAEAFARWLLRWRGEGLEPVRRAWLAAAHPIGTALSTTEGEGLFDGLDEDGALLLRLADGSRRVIHAGDVFLL